MGRFIFVLKKMMVFKDKKSVGKDGFLFILN